MAEPIVSGEDAGRIPEEVARALQDYLDEVNAAAPADLSVPPFLANTRHSCKKARQSAHAGKGVSTAMQLKERYVSAEDTSLPGDDLGSYAIVYREGACKKCGTTARSLQGRVVLTAERPPIEGRVGRA